MELSRAGLQRGGMSVRARAESGQASIEWVGAVAVVAGVLALAVAVAHGQDHHVGRVVTRQWARALCIVRAGDCWRDKEPCVVRSKDQHKGVTVKVLFVKLGGGYRAIVEQRSDGTVAVTRGLDVSLGAEGSAGFSADVKAGGVDGKLGAELSAAISAQLGGQMTWVVGSMAEADALVDGLKRLRVPSADVYAIEGGLHGEAGAAAVAEAFDTSVEAGKAGVSGDVHGGVRVDRVNGHRTIYVQGSWGAEASAAGGVLGWSHGGASDIYALELDEHGDPIDLKITSTGAYADPANLPELVRPATAMLRGGPGHGERVLEVTSHLDLTIRENRALATALVGSALRRALPGPSGYQQIRQRIAEAGSVEARVLSRASTSKGIAGEVAIPAAKIGIEASSDTTSMQLQAAASRGLDGQWLPRTDCVPAAA